MRLEYDLFGNPTFDYYAVRYDSRQPAPAAKQHKRSYKFVDLFCGGGAFHLAFSEQEMQHRCVLACDIQNFIELIYKLNFPDTPFHKDVYTLNENNLPYNDIICGGFPCQAFSIGGNQLGFDDPRGVLFFEIVRLAKIHNTKALILENVPGLLGINNGKEYKIILKTLHDAGYTVFHKILNSSTHGNIPQNRERLFIVAFNNKVVKNTHNFKFPHKIPLRHTAQDFLLPVSEIPSQYFITKDYHLHDFFYNELIKLNAKPGIIYHKKYGRIVTYEHNTKIISCITRQCGGGTLTNLHSRFFLFTDDYRLRVITLEETRRFMGFPLYYKFPDCKIYNNFFMLGNSIVVPVAERLVTEVLRVLDSNDF